MKIIARRFVGLRMMLVYFITKYSSQFIRKPPDGLTGCKKDKIS
jgi:hypothetical protein